MNEDQLLSLASLAVVAGMAVALAVAALTNKKEEKEGKIWTELKCTSCGYTEKREWKEGDFVGLVEGSCPKCGSPMEVWNIYKEGGEEENSFRLGPIKSKPSLRSLFTGFVAWKQNTT